MRLTQLLIPVDKFDTANKLCVFVCVQSSVSPFIAMNIYTADQQPRETKRRFSVQHLYGCVQTLCVCVYKDGVHSLVWRTQTRISSSVFISLPPVSPGIED